MICESFRNVPKLVELPELDHKLEIKDIDPGKFHKVDEVRMGQCDVCEVAPVSWLGGGENFVKRTIRGRRDRQPGEELKHKLFIS